MSSFTTMDSASNYSFKIPHSSFLESYARYVSLVDECIREKKAISGRFQLINLKVGRKPISEKSKKVVIDVTKGLKQVCLSFFFHNLEWTETPFIIGFEKTKGV